jgi:hypothetical protein
MNLNQIIQEQEENQLILQTLTPQLNKLLQTVEQNQQPLQTELQILNQNKILLNTTLRIFT